MGNRGSGLCRSQGSSSCVRKKVQDLDGPSGASDFRAEPVPVDSLLRKEPGVFKAEGF